MKKYLSYLLIACTIMAVQPLLGVNASAKPVVDTPNTSLDTNQKNEETSIPKLVKVEQLSPNQIQVSYDKDVDVKLGTKATNYWIQDMRNAMPKAIATLGKNDKVNANNSLKDNLVRISQMDGSKNTFILTFSQSIPRGEEYKVIVCYVTVEGAPPYSGDNGMITFVSK